jgi:hypothetical protein
MPSGAPSQEAGDVGLAQAQWQLAQIMLVRVRGRKVEPRRRALPACSLSKSETPSTPNSTASHRPRTSLSGFSGGQKTAISGRLEGFKQRGPSC